MSDLINPLMMPPPKRRTLRWLRDASMRCANLRPGSRVLVQSERGLHDPARIYYIVLSCGSDNCWCAGISTRESVMEQRADVIQESMNARAAALSPKES